MANITLSVSDALFDDMKRFSEIKWSEVARKAIAERVEVLKMAEKLAQKSKLKPEDAASFDRMIKAMAAKRFLE